MNAESIQFCLPKEFHQFINRFESSDEEERLRLSLAMYAYINMRIPFFDLAISITDELDMSFVEKINFLLGPLMEEDSEANFMFHVGCLFTRMEK
jgi:hypothetical protein